MTGRYVPPALALPGEEWKYYGALEEQDYWLEHEEATLEGRPCRSPECNRPEPIPESPSQAEWCEYCGGTKGDKLFGICRAHFREWKTGRLTL